MAIYAAFLLECGSLECVRRVFVGYSVFFYIRDGCSRWGVLLFSWPGGSFIYFQYVLVAGCDLYLARCYAPLASFGEASNLFGCVFVTVLWYLLEEVASSAQVGRSDAVLPNRNTGLSNPGILQDLSGFFRISSGGRQGTGPPEYHEINATVLVSASWITLRQEGWVRVLKTVF